MLKPAVQLQRPHHQVIAVQKEENRMYSGHKCNTYSYPERKSQEKAQVQQVELPQQAQRKISGQKLEDHGFTPENPGFPISSCVFFLMHRLCLRKGSSSQWSFRLCF